MQDSYLLYSSQKSVHSMGFECEQCEFSEYQENLMCGPAPVAYLFFTHLPTVAYFCLRHCPTHCLSCDMSVLIDML